MLKEKTNRWFLALGAALLCAGLGAAALWDLEIDLALYSPGFLPAVLMEAFVISPSAGLCGGHHPGAHLGLLRREGGRPHPPRGGSGL